MAKTPNVSPPPPPPAPPVPANPVDNAPGTEPDPLDSSVQSQPTPPVPPAPAGTVTTATPSTPAPDASPADTPLNGPGEIDGGAPEPASTPDPVDGENGRVTRDAELHGGVKAGDYIAPDPDAEFDDIDPKLTENTRADEIARRGFKAGRRGSPLGQRRKRMTDNEWTRYQASHAAGKQQGEVDQLGPEERMIRVEKVLGLAIPGAKIYEDDGE